MLLPIDIQAPLEPLRPAFHFTAPKGWLNDPNGLIFRDGKYHMFYQHNPFGTEWGNMTWGHAVSKDLLRWEHLPNALEPDSLGTMFSGSAVIDHKNHSGFGEKGKPPMLLFYTAAGGTNEASKGKPFTQCLAWSLDGKTFTKYSGNPIIGHVVHENRDPKVFWHQPSNQWVMVTYLTDDLYQILGSQNLKSWTELSRFNLKGASECPDFFELPLDGNKKQSHWVFWGANGRYQVGSFDGRKFEPTTPVKESYFGNASYAAQTFSNAPGGQVIQIAWFRGSDFPKTAWNQQMGFPNRLTLKSTPSGPSLAFNPVDTAKSLRKKTIRPTDGNYPVESGLLELEGEWKLEGLGDLRFSVNGHEVSFNAATKKLSVLGKEVVIDSASGKLKLRLIADRTSLEIYAQEGLVFMPFFVLPKQGAKNGVEFASSSVKTGVKVYELAP